MATSTLTPTKRSLLAVTSPDFLRVVRESEAIRAMEYRLDLESLVAGDPVYHPLSRYDAMTTTI